MKLCNFKDEIADKYSKEKRVVYIIVIQVFTIEFTSYECEFFRFDKKFLNLRLIELWLLLILNVYCLEILCNDNDILVSFILNGRQVELTLWFIYCNFSNALIDKLALLDQWVNDIILLISNSVLLETYNSILLKFSFSS